MAGESTYIGFALTWNSVDLAAETVRGSFDEQIGQLPIRPATNRHDSALPGREARTLEVELYVKDSVITALANRGPVPIEWVDGDTGQKYTGSGTLASKGQPYEAEDALMFRIQITINGALTREAVA